MPPMYDMIEVRVRTYNTSTYKAGVFFVLIIILEYFLYSLEDEVDEVGHSDGDTDNSASNERLDPN